MLKIDSNMRMRLFRGDTGTFKVGVKINNEDYVLQEEDEVIFSVKSDIDDTSYILQKIADNDETKAIFTLLPADTAQIAPDNYTYDIVLKKANGEVNTLMPDYKLGVFQLFKGVTE